VKIISLEKGAKMDVNIDPALPVIIKIDIRSPHLVSYRASFQIPGNPPIEFADVKEPQTVDQSVHFHSIGIVLSGTLIGVVMSFVGTPNTAFRSVVSVIQADNESDALVLEGTTSNGGVAIQHEVFHLL
jgi:hypothetical protein